MPRYRECLCAVEALARNQSERLTFGSSQIYILYMQEFGSSVAHALPHPPKTLTGIEGPDEITEGGLPLGRPTLICGSAGCGKTLMGIEFLVRGI